MNMFIKCCLLICAVLVNISEPCSNSVYPYENYLATKTPYRIVANKSFNKIEYEGCTSEKVWMIVRHGTRNPSAYTIERYINRLPEIRDLILQNDQLPNDFIHNRDLDLFRKWKSRLEEDDEKKLSEEGEEEMLLLAERMQNRFPEVFANVYSNTSYKFKYTHTQRAKKSALYFAAGLFGKKTARDVWFPTPLKKDPVLRFYKLCNKWRLNVKVKSIPELEKFKRSEHWKRVVENINARLNFDNELSSDDIQTMYLICGFETAWNKVSKSPWCSLFSIDEFKALEYLEDLKYYWIDGYGHELNYKQACPAFNDIIDFFDSEEIYPKSTLYFTHSGTLLKMLAHFGLYKDEKPLTADDFVKNLDRKWRTSFIDTFATNLAFILYRCGNEQKVLSLHQENIIRLPSCPDSDLCELKKIKEYYTESINNCNFDSMCATT